MAVVAIPVHLIILLTLTNSWRLLQRRNILLVTNNLMALCNDEL